uniref:Acid-sensing ion channel 1 n=1 Tax=Strongyloides stercoralis TaxID=6248 RepID=A0A0K0E4A5_STRER
MSDSNTLINSNNILKPNLFIVDRPKVVIQRPSIDETDSIININLTDLDDEKKSKRRKSKDSTNDSIDDNRMTFRNRASQMFKEFPTQHLKKFAKTKSMSTIRREVAFFSGITTIHSVVRIYRSKGIYKVLWIAACITSLTLLVLQCNSVIKQYYSKPTVSQVSFIIPEGGLDFPTITICSYNPVKRSYVEELNSTGLFSKELLDYLTLAYLQITQMFTIGDYDRLIEGDTKYQLYKSEVNTNFTINGFFRAASFSCEEIFKVCSFAGREFNCCLEATETLTDMGKCFKLDLKSSKNEWLRKQKQSGASSGLMIIADFHKDEQMGYAFGKQISEESIFANEFETGFRYYIHTNGTIPYLNTEGISVSPGIRSYSAIEPNKIELLTVDDWGNCNENWPPGYKDDIFYTAPNCKARCRATYFFNKCGCSPFVFNIGGVYPVCTAFQIYQCLAESYEKLSVRSYQLIPNPKSGIDLPICPECKQECDSWKYYTYNSYGQEFSIGALSWLHNRNRNWTASKVIDNFVAINIFYRDMTYTVYTQVQSTSFVQTISNIGGNAGLFMGVSFISCCEFSVFLWKLFWAIISKNRQNYIEKKRLKEKFENNRNKNNNDGNLNDDHPHGLRENAKNQLKQIGSYLTNGFISARKTSKNDSIHNEKHKESCSQIKLGSSNFIDNIVTNNLTGLGRAEDFIDVEKPELYDRGRFSSFYDYERTRSIVKQRERQRLRSLSYNDSPDYMKKDKTFVF